MKIETKLHGGRVLLIRSSDATIDDLWRIAHSHIASSGKPAVVHIERDADGVSASIEYIGDHETSEIIDDEGETIQVRSDRRLDTEHASMRAALALQGHDVEPGKPDDIRPGRGGR